MVDKKNNKTEKKDLEGLTDHEVNYIDECGMGGFYMHYPKQNLDKEPDGDWY